MHLNRKYFQCNLECLDTVQTTNEPEVLQTKAALLIAKIIDNNLDLKRFDQLRIQLKEEAKQKGRKTTIREKEEYKKLLAKLQITLLSIKYKIKDELKEMERELRANGAELHSSNTTQQYKDLRTRLEHIKIYYLYGHTLNCKTIIISFIPHTNIMPDFYINLYWYIHESNLNRIILL